MASPSTPDRPSLDEMIERAARALVVRRSGGFGSDAVYPTAQDRDKARAALTAAGVPELVEERARLREEVNFLRNAINLPIGTTTGGGQIELIPFKNPQ